jgi:putative heme-binding domain-containing protein
MMNPAVNVRNLGFTRLASAGAASINPVKKLLATDDPYIQARAIWLLAQLGPEGIKTVESALKNKNADIRITAYRALRQKKQDILPFASLLAGDPSAAVRREVALSLRDIPVNKSRETILRLASSYDGADKWFLEALGMAMEGKEDELYPLLKDRMGKEPAPQWSKQFADLTWRLHPAAAIENLKARAISPAVSGTEQTRALVALAFINDKKAADAMKSLAGSNINEVGTNASWWLAFRKSNDWIDWVTDGTRNIDSIRKAGDVHRNRMLALHKTLLDPVMKTEEKNKIAAEMAKDPVGGQLLIDLASAQKLSPEILNVVSQTIFSNPDQGIRVQATNYFQRPGISKTYSIDAIRQLKPATAAGRAVFAGSCATCHKAGNLGNDLGPDLTTIGKKYDRVSLLDAIINPGASIVFGYEPWLVTTRDGKSVYGFLIGDGQTVVMKDVARQQHVIKTTDIVSRKKMDQSIMPDPSSLGLDEKKLADVAEFLLMLK